MKADHGRKGSQYVPRHARDGWQRGLADGQSVVWALRAGAVLACVAILVVAGQRGAMMLAVVVAAVVALSLVGALVAAVVRALLARRSRTAGGEPPPAIDTDIVSEAGGT